VKPIEALGSAPCLVHGSERDRRQHRREKQGHGSTDEWCVFLRSAGRSEPLKASARKIMHAARQMMVVVGYHWRVLAQCRRIQIYWSRVLTLHRRRPQAQAAQEACSLRTVPFLLFFSICRRQARRSWTTGQGQRTKREI
jgi:hypothetical protein